LLEAAALVGADLAVLVTRIPQRMNIEGLRPRLVAAVADYRMKLSMHESAADTCRSDRVSLLRELGHRSRRGMRQSGASFSPSILFPSLVTREIGLTATGKKDMRHPVQRPSRYRLAVRLPIR